MGKLAKLTLLFSSSFVISSLAPAAPSSSAPPLSYDYYNETCPNLERIIHNVVSQKQMEDRNTAAAALRIFFHDCFVQGCDASVLIASTEANKAERDAEINLSLPRVGFDVFSRAKRALELKCPGVVSCADVMAIATRDLVTLVGGPSWEVLKGRKDGLRSKAGDVAGNLPRANQTTAELIALFSSKNLTVEDMVALSGAHTIGFSHCKEFVARLYSYNNSFDGADPDMDRDLALRLRVPCPAADLDPAIVAANDATTPFAFDNAYYQNLQKGLGLLATDQGLHRDARTRDLVETMATNQSAFFDGFAAAMVKLGGLGVKTSAEDGQVCRDCSAFNVKTKGNINLTAMGGKEKNDHL